MTDCLVNGDDANSYADCSDEAAPDVAPQPRYLGDFSPHRPVVSGRPLNVVWSKTAIAALTSVDWSMRLGLELTLAFDGALVSPRSMRAGKHR